jgi:hypothetical protein
MTRESHAASADSSGSGRALAFPSSTWMAGVRGIRSRIAADGSTARTLRSNQSLKAAANWPGPRADVDQNHSLRRAQVTSDRLAPLPKSVAWDLADRLVGCSGAFVIADPGHAMPPLMPTSCLPQKRDVAEAPIQPLTRCAASFHRRTATSGVIAERWRRRACWRESLHSQRVVSRDRWAEWLAGRRLGGDAEIRQRFLSSLTAVREKVLDRAGTRGG